MAEAHIQPRRDGRRYQAVLCLSETVSVCTDTEDLTKIPCEQLYMNSSTSYSSDSEPQRSSRRIQKCFRLWLHQQRKTKPSFFNSTRRPNNEKMEGCNSRVRDCTVRRVVRISAGAACRQ